MTLFTNSGLDTANLAPWKAGFGAKRGGDADGDADGSDFLMWQRNALGAPSTAAVAEPAAAVLGLLAWAVGSGMRRGRRRALPGGGPSDRG